MRITNYMKMNSLLYNLDKLQNRIFLTQNVLSTGEDLQRVSDDPARADRVMNLNGQLSRLSQYDENLQNAETRLSHTDFELQSILDVISEVRTVALQGANEAMNDEDRQDLAVQIDNYLHDSIAIANSKYNGQYIFGGYNTQEAPYSTVTDQDTGDVIGVRDLESNMDGITTVTTSDGEQIQANIPGTAVFQAGEPGDDGDFFQVLIDLRDALRENDQETIEGVITRLDDAQQRITDSLALTGSLVARITTLKSRIMDNELTTTDHLSETKDADITEWISRYQLDQVALQNAMQVGTNILNNSLLNFI